MEEYFEAHSSSKVLTSDRTLQKLRKRRLSQVRFSESHNSGLLISMIESSLIKFFGVALFTLFLLIMCSVVMLI